MADNRELFTTKEQRELAVANFRTLKTQAGWQLLTEIVEANIKVLEEQILNGFEDETKEVIDRKRDKLKAYKEVITTPDYWINTLESKATFKEEDDPYHTVETLAHEKMNRD